MLRSLELPRVWLECGQNLLVVRVSFKQHLYAGAEAIGLSKKERHNWMNNKLRLINRGKVQQVIKILKAIGLPIESGEVESAHRYIPQKRLKIPRATGHLDTVNPVLALKVIRANNWRDDFWTEQSAKAKVA